MAGLRFDRAARLTIWFDSDVDVAVTPLLSLIRPPDIALIVTERAPPSSIVAARTTASAPARILIEAGPSTLGKDADYAPCCGH